MPAQVAGTSRVCRHPNVVPVVHVFRWAGLGVALAWLAARPRRLEVRGDSMAPTLNGGDRAIALRPAWVGPGDLVVLPDPDLPERQLVKRVLWQGRPEGGRRVVWVEGDNVAASTDSRSFGLVRRREVRGVLVWVYHPPERVGSCWRIGWAGNATPRRPVLSHLATGAAWSR